MNRTLNQINYSSGNIINENISASLDFILSHFCPPIYPRTISTSNTSDRQRVIYEKDEIMARYRNADFKDCRINAYPHNDRVNHNNYKIPNLLFIDLDKSAFKTELGLKRGLKITLDNIKNYLCGVPTVLSTGNGFHVYQPITAINLEDIADFNDLINDDPNNKFLRFAARYLSNNKSDPNNYQSVKSCMLRIPHSINSKNNSVVKIIQKWDGLRTDFTLLLGSLYACYY